MRPHDPTVSARHSGEIKYMNGHESQNTSSSNLTPAGPESISRILDGTIYTRTLLPFFENGGYILLRVRSGEGMLISGGREYPMIAGYALLYRAHLPAVVDLACDSLSLSAFCLTRGLGDVFHDTLPVHRFPETAELSCALQRNFRRTACRTSAAIEEDPIKEIMNVLRRCAEAGPEKPLTAPYYMAAMKNILDSRYGERISLDGISRELHMNKFKLAKEFKALFSSSPIEYLINRRIESAAKLLFATDRSVTQIAADVAMENVSYFVRRFRETYGTTPLRYRMTARENSDEHAAQRQEDKFSPESGLL